MAKDIKKSLDTYRNLCFLRSVRLLLGVVYSHVTITLNGKEFQVKTRQEADEILEAYADWLEK